MIDSPPRLLLVAHGTRSAPGSATTARIAAAVAAARPGLRIDLCFLDVAAPTLADALADEPELPTVVIPMLLSTGYHVQHDIPDAVRSYRNVAVARHLGPHTLLTRALVDRLRAAGGQCGVRTVLVGAGSSRPDAAAELEEAARLLGGELDAEVLVRTMADDLPAVLGAHSGPLQVATYLLAEGQFTDAVRTAFGALPVAAPIGDHEALVELILNRYDTAAAPPN